METGPGSREDGRSVLENHIRVEPVTPVIGAEVSGVDLSAPLAPAAVDAIRAALMKHQVLFFRDQQLTWPQHKAFGRRFGDLHVHPAAPKDAEHPEILVVHADGDSKFVSGELWHSDVSCDVDPPMGSILRVEQAPPSGGDTLFASMYAAWEALSDRMQRLLEELTAVTRAAVLHCRYGGDNLRDGALPVGRAPRGATIRDGRSALYVNEGFTTGFKELKRAESDALLAFLVRHCASPELQCRFRWRADSVAFWDNRCTQHHAVWDYYPEVRHGYRVTIQGDRPFYAPAARAGQASAEWRQSPQTWVGARAPRRHRRALALLPLDAHLERRAHMSGTEWARRVATRSGAWSGGAGRRRAWTASSMPLERRRRTAINGSSDTISRPGQSAARDGGAAVGDDAGGG